jgi:hypothetical protein
MARLSSDPRFMRGLESFYGDWLSLKGFKEVARDDAGLTTEVLADLQSSLLSSATALYTSATPNIQSLFSGQLFRRRYGAQAHGQRRRSLEPRVRDAGGPVGVGHEHAA